MKPIGCGDGLGDGLTPQPVTQTDDWIEHSVRSGCVVGFAMLPF